MKKSLAQKMLEKLAWRLVNDRMNRLHSKFKPETDWSCGYDCGWSNASLWMVKDLLRWEMTTAQCKHFGAVMRGYVQQWKEMAKEAA